MNKETEEIILYVIIGLVVLKVLTAGNSLTTRSAAQLSANTDLGYANDAASVLNNAIDNWS